VTRFKAFLFDLNGTMVDDMAYHINAWHGILKNLGSDISIEQTRSECYGKNDELLERVFPGRFTMEEKTSMGFEKEKKYQEDFRPYLKLINGLEEFLKLSDRNQIKMAVGSAAIMFNIKFVIDGLNIRDYFSALVSADDVKISKPHPETFLKCAEEMGMEPGDCLVFEDAPKGVETALNAGMKVVVLLTMHEKEEFESYPNVLFFIDDFTDEKLKELTA